MKKSSLCLDIGASKIRIAFVSGTKIENKKVFKTPKTKSEIKNLLFRILEKYLQIKKTKIRVSIAGAIKDNKIIYTPNMDFEGVNLKKILKEKFHVSVSVENDAKCAGMCESCFGAGKKYKNFVFLTLGTGIGGAIFADGKLSKGAGIGAEPGHMLFAEKQFEQLASGKASVEIALKKGLKVSNGYELEELAKKGNKKAISVYNQIGKNLGLGILNISYILDPEAIILGGGFSEVKFYWKEMNSFFHSQDKLKRKIPIIKSKFGDDSGLIGAAMLRD